MGVDGGGGALTPSNCRPSRRWRGTIVTSSISQRKAVSGGVRPGGRGWAMVWWLEGRRAWMLSFGGMASRVEDEERNVDQSLKLATNP